MFILTSYNSDMENKVTIGASDSIDVCISVAMKEANELLNESYVCGVKTGNINTSQIDSDKINIYYKTSTNMLVNVWMIRTIPTLTMDD